MSINDFITKLLSKLLRDLFNRVHLKSISKFINKIINRYCFCFVNEHLKTGPFTKIMSINNFVSKLTNTLSMDPIRKIPKKFTKKFGNKVINRQYFCRKTGL